MFSKLRLFIVIVLIVAGLQACSSPEEKARKHYENGVALLEKEDLDKAKIEFQNALQIDKKMTDAWFGLAQVAEKKTKWKRMFKMLNQVVTLKPDHQQAQLKLAQLYLASRQVEKALEKTDELMKIAPNDSDVLAVRASVMLSMKNNAGAIEHAQQGLKNTPNHPESLIVLAKERLSVDDPVKAIEYLNQGIAVEKDNIALRLAKIQALLKLEKFNEIETELQYLISANPDSMGFRENLAKLYLQQKRYDEAEQVYRDMAEKYPDDVEAKLKVISFINTLKGNAAAVDQVNAFIEKNPGDIDMHFALVQLFVSSNQLDGAIEKLNSIKTDFQDKESQVKSKSMLATLLLKKGDREGAFKLVDEVLLDDPRNEQALVLRATYQIEKRELDKAIANLRTILKDTPDSPRALLLLAKAHQFNGASELAEDMYARAFDASGYASEYGLNYAEFLLKLKRQERAADVLEEVLRVEPKNLPTLVALSQIKILMGEYAEAQDLANLIKELEGKAVGDQIIGMAQAGQQEFGKSLESFKRAHEAEPLAMQPMEAVVRAYIRLGETDKAMALLDKSIAENQNNHNARYLKGKLYIIQNQLNDAETVFLDIIKRVPKSPVGYTNLVDIYLQNRNIDQAKAIVEQGLENMPGDINLQMKKAGLLELTQDIEGAIAVYEAVLEKNPQADVVINNLASLLSDFREDDASLKRAHELALRFKDSKIPQFKDTLGWTYFRMGDAQTAEQMISEAVKAMPGEPGFRYHLGLIQESLGNKDAAREELTQALSLSKGRPFPYREKANEVINRL